MNDSPLVTVWGFDFEQHIDDKGRHEGQPDTVEIERTLADGTVLSLTITHEGIIVDHNDVDGENLGSYWADWESFPQDVVRYISSFDPADFI